MRFLTAAILFVVSATLILLGLAQRTIWHPPAAHVQHLQTSKSASLLVIKHSVLTQYPGTPKITVNGGGKVYIATARQSDIDAWVGSTTHLQVSEVTSGSGSAPVIALLSGSGKPANPAGSDLWRTEVTGSTSAALRVATAEQAAVLVAADGISPAPTNLVFQWPIDFNPVPSNVMIIVGGVLLLAALVVNIWAWYHMRKLRGPRRRTPKAPQGPRLRRQKTRSSAPVRGRRSARNFAVLAATSVLLGGLTGCTSPGQASPTPTSSVPNAIQQPPVVTTVQLHRIVRQISAVVRAADSARDSKLLAGRVAGPALDSRKAHYTLQKASKKVNALPPIASAKLKVILPAATNLWPRTVMVITSNGVTDTLPQMLVLQQKSPRAQYQLWYNIDMLPGVKLPVVNTAAVGAIPVASDSLFLKIAPNALPVAFGDLIDNGPSSLSAPMFNVTNDEYYQQIYASQQSQAQTLNNATIKMKHLLGDPNVLSLSTLNSGALVAVYMNDKYVIKPKDRTQAVAVSGNEKLMLGAAGSATGIKSFYGSMLLFYVPSISSKDKIITLGATQELLSVKSL